MIRYFVTYSQWSFYTLFTISSYSYYKYCYHLLLYLSLHSSCSVPCLRHLCSTIVISAFSKVRRPTLDLWTPTPPCLPHPIRRGFPTQHTHLLVSITTHFTIEFAFTNNKFHQSLIKFIIFHFRHLLLTVNSMTQTCNTSIQVTCMLNHFTLPLTWYCTMYFTSHLPYIYHLFQHPVLRELYSDKNYFTRRSYWLIHFINCFIWFN